MIYNWTEYLRTKFPAEIFFSNQRHQIGGASIPDKCVLSKEYGGIKEPWIGTLQKAIQVTVRDFEIPSARELAYSIYNEMHDKYGLVLSASTVDGVVYPQLHTAEIKANQEPFCIGTDSEGRIEFTINFTIYFRSE